MVIRSESSGKGIKATPWLDDKTGAVPDHSSEATLYSPSLPCTAGLRYDEAHTS